MKSKLTKVVGLVLVFMLMVSSNISAASFQPPKNFPAEAPKGNPIQFAIWAAGPDSKPDGPFATNAKWVVANLEQKPGEYFQPLNLSKPSVATLKKYGVRTVMGQLRIVPLKYDAQGMPLRYQAHYEAFKKAGLSNYEADSLAKDFVKNIY